MRFRIVIFIIILSTYYSSNSLADCSCTEKNNSNVDFDQALNQLIQTNNNSLALEILRNGINPDTKNSCGNSLLLISSALNNIDLTKILIAKGADLNTTNLEGISPVFFAAQSSSNTVLKALLENGADPNIIVKDCLNTGYNSPLLIAAINNNIEGVRLLLEHGADPTYINEHNGALYSPYSLLVQYEHEKIQPLINSTLDPNLPDSLGENLVTSSAQLFANDLLYFLLNNGGNPNYVTDIGHEYNSALLKAAVNRNIEGVSILLEHGADIDYKNSMGYTLERVVNEENLHELMYLFEQHETTDNPE